MIGADAALVVAEDQVNEPMKAVLDGPMCAKMGRLADVSAQVPLRGRE
jgi:hypothetical protein